MKKRLLSIILAAVMVLGLSSCTIKLSTTNTPGGMPEIIENTVTVPEVTTSGEITLEDRMEEKTTIELIRADIAGDSYIAPAKDIETHLWGYIDLNGKWVVKPQYRTASEFTGDYACVSDVYGDYMFIDRTGEVLLDQTSGIAFSSASYFSEGLANVKLGVDFVQQMTYIDEDGSSVFNLGKLPLAKGVSYKTSKYVELATPFRNGYALVMRTTNATLDSQGIGALECAYVIDEDGDVYAALPQGLDVSEYGFDENMRVVVRAENGLFGLADTEGEVIVSPSYLHILYCEDGLYLACAQSGFWGFLDKDGKAVIDFRYNNAMPFSEGRAAVCSGNAWGFINVDGDLVIPYIYDDVKALKPVDSGSEENNGAFCCGVAVVRVGRYWGVIDKIGEILFAAESEDCPITSISNGYISFEYSGGCGVFTTEGRLVLVPEFEKIGEFR